MKTIFFRKDLLFSFLATVIMAFVFISCEKDNNDDTNNATYNTSGNASGGQQNPPVTTTGSGTLSGTYNAQTNNWQYSVNWTALTTAATIVELRGPANVGVNGNLLLTLTISVPGINGSASGNVTLTDQQEAYLLAGQLYYTVLTATHVTGEIRGQVTATQQ
jgi:hypothetical protein